MPNIMIKCPTTQKPLSTGINMDKRSYESSTLMGNSVDCPYCKRPHTWSKKDSYLAKE
jgi:endogenous inhibitor of DNA gyrase (YacG/DUF329 family)